MGRADHILCTLRDWHDFPRAFADNEYRGRSGFWLVGIAARGCRRHGGGDSFVLFEQMLLRLSPVVPFGLLNYLLGLTNTSFVTYVTCTVIGILPGSIIDIYIGVIGKSAGNTAQFAYLLAGLIATAALVVLITVKARGYLREAGIKV